MWKGYIPLNNMGYKHHTVNHSEAFKDPHTDVHTNRIEENWAGIKRLCTSSYRRKKYISFYLTLFILNRIYGDNLFQIILDKILKD